MDSTTSDTRGRWLVLAAAFLGWMFDGLEMGIFPLVARPALQDMMQGRGRRRPICWAMDGAHHGAVSGGRRVWRAEFRLDWGPPWARARDDTEHFDLLGIYGFMLFRSRAMAPGRTEICGGFRHGRRMVARSCAGDGGVARGKTPLCLRG
jgi:hypothetical protein